MCDIPKGLWQELLALSTSVQKPTAEGYPDEEPVQSEISEVNREFVEAALRETASSFDPSRIFVGYLVTLHELAHEAYKLSEDDEARVIDIFDRLEDLIQQGHLSEVFFRNGGIFLLETYIFKCPSNEIRAAACVLILSWAENQETIQNSIVQTGLFEKLVELLKNEATVDEVVSSALSAVSATVRSNITSFEKFRQLDCRQIFLNIIRTRKTKIAAKAARILASISSTMQSYEQHSKYLTEAIIDSYIFLAAQKHMFELDFIRDFIKQYVEKSDLNDDKLTKVRETLKLEHERGTKINQEHENEFDIKSVAIVYKKLGP